MGHSASDKCARTGHPSVQELVAEQGTKFRTDPVELLGEFWPEEESLEDFLRALNECRGHDRSESRRMTPVVVHTVSRAGPDVSGPYRFAKAP